jgi:hypothetical protein
MKMLYTSFILFRKIYTESRMDLHSIKFRVRTGSVTGESQCTLVTYLNSHQNSLIHRRKHKRKLQCQFYFNVRKPPLWSSGQSFWLQVQGSRVRFQALPDYLRSSGSGTGSTQPREDNRGAT